jgi:hypothetical protein
MKLDKSDLFFIFDSVDALSEKGSYQAESLAEEAYSALYHDELEIEGYHKTEWIEFNPNDPKTFPPVGDFIFFQGCEEGYGYIGTGHRNEEDTDEAFASRAIYPYLTHWLPAPQPPVGKQIKAEK